jgi:hypothetical protein
MDEYVVLAWSLASFIGGVIAGGAVVYKLAVIPALPKPRPGNTWARTNVHAVEARLEADTFVRKEEWYGSGMTDGRTISFSVQDASGMQRDMTYSAATLFKFFKCDTPARREWRGDNAEYSRLISVGKHYNWIVKDGAGYLWMPFLGTRERRLKAIECWMET